MRSFDERAAHYYADLVHRAVSLRDRDLRVASIALARDLIVVTSRVARFDAVPGLTVEDWSV